jgi:predicted Fe-S protein YdhL (DUF1289 family)
MSASPNQAKAASLSPCVGICRLDASNTCIGCGRLLSEVAAWSRMSLEERRKVCELAARRLAGLRESS